MSRWGAHAADVRHSALRLIAALALLLLIGWGLGELAGSAARSTDLTAVRDLAADRTSALTGIARALSLIGSGYVVFPVALASAVALYASGRRSGAAVVVLATLGAVVIANVDKVLVDRSRPPVHHLEHVTSPSFPSGHASQSTGLLLALTLVLLAVRPSRAWTLVSGCAGLVLVAAIAWSRVYLGVHYPTDVAAGILLAGAWTVVVYRVLPPAVPEARGV